MSGRELDAEQDLAKIVREDTAEIEAYLALAEIYRRRGEVGRAITMYQNLNLRGDLGSEQREAVLCGLGLAFEMSARLGMCPQEAPSRVAAHLAAMGAKARLADIEGELPGGDALMALMANDKKAKGGRIAFILADDIGRARVVRDADPDAARAVLADQLAERGR